jgi:hypothetical protein
MKTHRIHNSEKQSLINNIKNRDTLPNHVVISAIQQLCHLDDWDWESILLPLLDSHDLDVAGTALSALCDHYGQREKLTNQIVKYASTYLFDDLDNELQFIAILQLEELAKNDKCLLKSLKEIAEFYSNLTNNSNAMLINAAVWESLARLGGLKLSGREKKELVENSFSTESEMIRNRIRNL